jgi:uncharacterized membrane protein
MRKSATGRAAAAVGPVTSLGDSVRGAVGNAASATLKNVGGLGSAKAKTAPLSGAMGIAAGVGLAAAAPLARKGVRVVRAGRLARTPVKVAEGAATKVGDHVGSKLKDGVSEKVDEAGGAGGLVKEAASGLIPGLGGGDSSGGNGGMPDVGKGRRMPVQQSVDVAVPLETAYNQFTQFEDWPEFMHRVTRVTQEDDCTIGFATKIWGKTKEFEANIETQRPDQRIKWRVAQGITHSGVVTFHELAPSLTRIEVNLDVDPGSLIEKAARGMRHVKRAVRADLHRFKAFIEMQELETGAWRGVIEDGELVEPHDDEYDEERDYSDVEDLRDEAESSEDEDEDEDKDDDQPVADEDLPRDGTGRFKKGAGAKPMSKTAAASSGSSSRSSGGTRSKSGGSSNGKSDGKTTAKSSGSKSTGSKSSASKSTAKRTSGSGRKRGSSNGSGSTQKRSSTTRRRTSSRS